MEKFRKYSTFQKSILEKILEGPIRQTTLTNEFKKDRSTIKYHVDRLMEENLIKKETIMEVGGVKINEISANLLSLHRIREILGLKVEGSALITGFGSLGTGYEIPDLSYK